MRLAICLCVYEYALEEVWVGRMRGYPMRLVDALEIFEGMVKVYGVCVWIFCAFQYAFGYGLKEQKNKY